MATAHEDDPLTMRLSSMTDRSRARAIGWACALVLGTLAFAVVLQITDPPAPVLDPDSVSYIGNAESLVARHEFRTPTQSWWSPDSTRPLTHFPPGFSTLIAIPTALGMPPVQASRLVNALAAFVTMTTLVLLMIEASAPLVGLLTGAALLVMSAMLEVHVSVLSEPVFLAFMSLLLATMVRRPTQALTMGTFAALGTLVRYVGVSLIGAAVVWSVAQQGPIALRLRRAALALVPAVVLQGAWVLRTRRVGSTAAIRRFALYGDLQPTLTQGFGTIKAWLVQIGRAHV